MIYFYSILIFSWAFFVALFAIPSIIQVAHSKQLLDIPNSRRLHLFDTPRLGGLAIFAGLISALMLFGEINNAVQKLIAATIIIFFIGLKDDMVSVSAFKKFFVQVLAASIVVFLGDLKIESFQGVFGITVLPDGISYFFTLIVVLGITNAFNLIDGLDGLAGTIAVLTCLFYGYIFMSVGGAASHPYALVCFCLTGALLGFLRYNIFKAQIFMGDTGSLISGFVVAFLAVKIIALYENNGYNLISLPAVAIAPILLPLADTLRVFVLRVLAGYSPFTPDSNHLHHRLMALGFSSLSIVCLMFLCTICSISAAMLMTQVNQTVLLIGMFGGIFILMAFIEIIYKKRTKACISNL
ncbi:MraY family glycosyltransferase [Cytophaga hutchinsonii]|jgi:UDP-GlcNAc:undecaprenyl-phosphate GlcNAc-1-phosphate transferase|uniref:Probable glycosyltransferase/acetylmuramyl pentapeptide phosphotransferase n=1 Tax=Cytophaga hutchinsonii (strain ATCC 33406 / DSM 1761 / CIP 103989 / NBRC 15051 / NCIMB 9469 / D465) TaxID=269798 RepID=A0A6N4SMH2_CYTH3|nr:MraY family glycosyltransferase [Cytophaga hutchinsonii]ABG57459.1 probable glycosyltransferase/acetylmuramyl pentapeptide phosphotransferase [Cytophaga hutchinsonii ATCC 33406]SFW98039.1 UDP-N-acetylmuramyl pentapeptide phosphotransferase/UDP-N-acetylglucosamine-1-phosphate transferase [Cytophaga hutchinsonii ATCC 33406]